MEKRKLKVYYECGRNYRRQPQIILKGLWLERMGFSVGDRLTVDCQPGRVVVTIMSASNNGYVSREVQMTLGSKVQN